MKICSTRNLDRCIILIGDCSGIGLASRAKGYLFWSYVIQDIGQSYSVPKNLLPIQRKVLMSLKNDLLLPVRHICTQQHSSEYTYGQNIKKNFIFLSLEKLKFLCTYKWSAHISQGCKYVFY